MSGESAGGGANGKGSTIRLHAMLHSPSSYMATLFRALSEIPGLELQVHYVDSVSPGRPWNSSVTAGYSWRVFRQTLGVDWRLVRTTLREKDAFFISACWGDLTNQICLMLAAMLGRRYAVWNDAPDIWRVRNPVKAKLRSWYLRFVFAHSAAVLGTGEPALRLLERMGCPQEKLINFPCFIDPYSFAPRLAGTAVTRPPVFISSGRLYSDKAYQDCIEALALVWRRTGFDFRYRLMGIGPEMKTLRAAAKLGGVEDKIEFVGWADEEVSRHIYETADVLLHPSRFEPFGVVVLEAMAAGVVVIASDMTFAALDRIRDGENGFLYRTGDMEELAAKIERVLRDPEMIRPLGIRARATAEEWPLSRAQDIIRRLVTKQPNGKE